jgi:hypothetical protein
MEKNQEEKFDEHFEADRAAKGVSVLDAVFKDIEKMKVDHEIEEIVVVFKMKDINDPMLFFINQNNHHYDAAAMLAKVMRNMKSKIITDLDC